jgi:hypothetical protein
MRVPQKKRGDSDAYAKGEYQRKIVQAMYQ